MSSFHFSNYQEEIPCQSNCLWNQFRNRSYLEAGLFIEIQFQQDTYSFVWLFAYLFVYNYEIKKHKHGFMPFSFFLLGLQRVYTNDMEKYVEGSKAEDNYNFEKKNAVVFHSSGL